MGCSVSSTPMKAPLGAGSSSPLRADGSGSDSRKTSVSVSALSLQSNAPPSNSPAPSSVDPLGLPLRSGSSGAPSPIDSNSQDAFSPTNDAASRGRLLELDKASVRLLENRHARDNPLEWDCRRHYVGTPHGSEDGSIVSCSVDSEMVREYESTERARPKSANGYRAIEPLTPGWLLIQEQEQHSAGFSLLPVSPVVAAATAADAVTRFQQWRSSRNAGRNSALGPSLRPMEGQGGYGADHSRYSTASESLSHNPDNR